MKKAKTALILFTVLSSIAFFIESAFGWFDETHIAVAKAAGYRKWYNVTGADISKIKAGKVEAYNHFFNNNDHAEVTPEMVFKQAERYNDPDDKDGHLYGAIIASVREHIKKPDASEYHIAFCAHYIGDLSQPFHSIPYDDFNKARHLINDGLIEREALNNIDRITRHMHKVALRPDRFEEDLAKEIARIADKARLLGNKLRKENRDMTKQEAYAQLGQSASLLKAVLQYIEKRGNNLP